MLKSNRMLSSLLLTGTTVLSVLLVSESIGQGQIPSRIRNPILTQPELVKPIRLGPKIVMERTPLQSPEGMKIYEMNRLSIQPNVIEQFRLQDNLIEKSRVQPLPRLQPSPVQNLLLSQGQLKTFVEPDNSFTRLSVDETKGNIYFLPKAEQLATHPGVLLNNVEALKAAQNHVNALRLLPSDSSQFMPQQVVTLKQAVTPPGGNPKVQNVLQTVIFSRMLDQKNVIGGGSKLFVDLGNQGKLEGLERQLQQLTPTNLPTQFRTNQEIYDDIEGILRKIFPNASEIRVKQPRLVYSGDNRRYVQPAYTFSAEIISPNAVGPAYYSGRVAALRNPPEPVVIPPNQNLEMPSPPKGEQPILFRPQSIRPLPLQPLPQLSLASPSLLASSPTGSISGPGPTVGRYVVRDDSRHWVDDANDLKGGLGWGTFFGFPSITYGDYYWDEPRLWLNQENSFVDRWNVVLMEGHGANWLFTTRSNCCDTVNLNAGTQPPYGDHASSSMRYLFLKGCSIVPALPDRANWADPWWRVFKGLRQAVGFRTSMYINDDISYHFGYHIALNSRILDSWFHATNASSSYTWERIFGGDVKGYGAVVMIPGHEGDGIYFTNPAPAATTTGLTIWWQE